MRFSPWRLASVRPHAGFNRAGLQVETNLSLRTRSLHPPIASDRLVSSGRATRPAWYAIASNTGWVPGERCAQQTSAERAASQHRSRALSQRRARPPPAASRRSSLRRRARDQLLFVAGRQTRPLRWIGRGSRDPLGFASRGEERNGSRGEVLCASQTDDVNESATSASTNARVVAG